MYINLAAVQFCVSLFSGILLYVYKCSGCVVEFHAAAILGGGNCLGSRAVVPVKFRGVSKLQALCLVAL